MLAAQQSKDPDFPDPPIAPETAPPREIRGHSQESKISQGCRISPGRTKRAHSATQRSIVIYFRKQPANRQRARYRPPRAFGGSSRTAARNSAGESVAVPSLLTTTPAAA